MRASSVALRHEIRSGALRGRALLDLLLAVPPRDRDGWIDALLGFETPPPEDIVDLPRGAVPYLPCGVEEILAMVAEVPLGPRDELVDLGSGLGRVLILAHLLSGARALGIELQEHLVRAAEERCAAFDLPITMIHGNAAELALDGSVFFLYAPFNGALLARVLERIRDVARRRPIVVCAVDLEFRDVHWLSPRATSSNAVVVYDGRDAW